MESEQGVIACSCASGPARLPLSHTPAQAWSASPATRATRWRQKLTYATPGYHGQKGRHRMSPVDGRRLLFIVHVVVHLRDLHDVLELPGGIGRGPPRARAEARPGACETFSARSGYSRRAGT